MNIQDMWCKSPVKLFRVNILVISILLLLTGILCAQNERQTINVEVVAKSIEQRALTNSTVSSKDRQADEELQPPPEFGGPKSKGVLCEVKFENRCGYQVDVYIDGNYKGTIDAWGDAWYRNISGYTTVYCMTVGRSYEWEAKGDCDGNYTFTLKKESSSKENNSK